MAGMSIGVTELIFADDDFTVRVLSVSEMDNNVYILTGRVSGQQVVIDAAADSEAIVAAARAALEEDFLGSGSGAGVIAVLTTHGHWDHVRALPAVLATFRARSFAGAADLAEIERLEGVKVDSALAAGQVLHFVGFSLEVISLRGHTPGSLAFAVRHAGGVLIFTGDSLFPGGVGKTNSAEDFQSLFADVKSKIFDVFADDTLILPGHGRSTSLGSERGSLDEWQQRGW